MQRLYRVDRLGIKGCRESLGRCVISSPNTWDERYPGHNRCGVACQCISSDQQHAAKRVIGGEVRISGHRGRRFRLIADAVSG